MRPAAKPVRHVPVQVAPGTHLYTGPGLSPFREGERAMVPEAHADDLMAARAVHPADQADTVE